MEGPENRLYSSTLGCNKSLHCNLPFQVLGYDSVNSATLELVNRLQKGFSVLEDETKKTREELQIMKEAHESRNVRNYKQGA